MKIRAHLDGRSRRWREHVPAALPERYPTPREQLLGVFEVLGESLALAEYHGCLFINASAEAPPGGVVGEVTDAHRSWVRRLLGDLARAAGAPTPTPWPRS